MRRRVMSGKKKLFIQRFFPAGEYEFIVPKGCESIDVFLVGGGGGAGGFRSAYGVMGGGGGGYTKTFKDNIIGWKDGNAIPVNESQVIPVTVGEGGLAADGGYSQFLNSSYRADGGKASTTWNKGGAGGSGGGSWADTGNNHGGVNTPINGGFNGGNALNGNGVSTSRSGVGQGHTTRDFGEPDGLINAGGGACIGNGITPNAGASDYSEGVGGFNAVVDGTWITAVSPSGGYGGGASVGYWTRSQRVDTKGGDGTVLIRYYAYRRGTINKI